VTRDLEFTDEKHVERNAEVLGHFVGDGDATAWKAKHDNVVPMGVGLQPIGELTASVMSISKGSRQGFS
jgi:hypothetical protein